MSSKRKRVVLSVSDKLKILEQLKKGASGSSLAREYGVGNATISDIKKKSESITKFARVLDSEDGSLHRKTMKMAENQDLDTAVYTWFMQVRGQGQPISGPLLCEKALEMNAKLGGNADFKASTGWLKRFKSRHGIRELDIQGEKLSADTEAGEKFKDSFASLLSEEGYDDNNVYNADETGLYWKKMPTKSLVSKKEMSAPGFKASKSRITAMVCANKTGTHRLPLLIIGKSKNPRCFKGIVKLPLTYKSQKNSWMDTSIFVEWYDTVFIPEVKKQHIATGSSGNVLLIIDNAPSHPSSMDLDREDGKFKVVFLPPNVTSVLQPMDQGVIESFKRYYRKALLRMVLLGQEEDKPILQLYKAINMKDAVYMAAEAWDCVKETTLKKAWNKLCPTEAAPTPEEPPTQFVSELVGLINQSPEFEDCDQDNIQEWLECDVDDPGYEVMTDDEIIAHVQENGDDDEEEDYDIDLPNENGPSHDEAFHCLETAMLWLEQQEECDSVQLLSLKRLRDLAAKKRVSGLKQKSILDFF
ncbi:jerky protein homolog-like [Macrosteles quadrilineatus]|uniref:jerky protein homolog-like n=1 Tax=Macrosteles quadrilineatus TaxID=74068 RepID=UPI0023E2AA7E|nr:jerky protein homolog-like [Macrosteles quadrilineatus]